MTTHTPRYKTYHDAIMLKSAHRTCVNLCWKDLLIINFIQIIAWIVGWVFSWNAWKWWIKTLMSETSSWRDGVPNEGLNIHLKCLCQRKSHICYCIVCYIEYWHYLHAMKWPVPLNHGLLLPKYMATMSSNARHVWNIYHCII